MRRRRDSADEAPARFDVPITGRVFLGLSPASSEQALIKRSRPWPIRGAEIAQQKALSAPVTPCPGFFDLPDTETAPVRVL